VPAEPLTDSEHVRRHGLTPGRYFLLVSRLVPEKRQLDLIEAYAATRLTEWRLVLVGALGSDEYSARVKSAAVAANVVLTGFLKGAALEQMYSHAGAFVLPSSHEGLPIALLEALSYGLPVLASDIPANLEVGLEPGDYFRLGDIGMLARCLTLLSQAPDDPARRAARRQSVAARYDWERLAEQTLRVYERVLRD
jgi:glycosyltransferase involved in cell wall biosynthesis